jgi:hypothetical protein
MTERTEMITEALDLGITHPGNISNIKLATLLAEFKGEPTPHEPAPAGPAMKVEPDEGDVKEASVEAREKIRQATRNKHVARRREVADLKKKALKTEIVTITNKDPRDNTAMTTAYLSFENQFFGAARLVPLDIPVELEVSLIKIAASCTMTLHKDEIGADGKRTGNKIPVRVKKYAISYSRQKPE